MRLAGVVVAALVLAAGCVQPAAEEAVAPASLLGADFDTSRGWSVPLSPALYEILEGVEVRVPSHDGVEISLGVFRPAIDGCDWDAEEVPESCRLSTVIDAGPYYGANVDKDKYRPPTVEWLVPRGYAVVQMALRGTGESGGCMEFKAPGDVEDVSAVIDALAATPWSDGDFGMIGRSYDGTGAWSGAASGNPRLKTIVPISGAVDAPGLYYKNGTSEIRGPIHPATYYPNNGLGLDKGAPDPKPEDVCADPAVLAAESATATATGDASSDYWKARDLRPAILEKYRGSVWVIHGLEDWNVNPSQAVPFLQHMQEAGIEVRAWLGVWGHAYPDRVDEHRNVRWDWAEQTVRWFDHYLKCTPGGGSEAASEGRGLAVGETDGEAGGATASADAVRTLGGSPICEKPWLGVEVEDNLFVWRAEETYPPRDAAWRTETVEGGVASAGTWAAWTLGPFEESFRVAGLPQLHLEATPTTPAGGHLFAELYDVYPDGRSARLGWAAINLRYHAGGNTEPATLVPGQAVRAHLEFEPVDALVAEGHRLRLVVHKDGVEDVLPSPDPSPVLLGQGELRLPVVERPTIVPTYRAPGL